MRLLSAALLSLTCFCFSSAALTTAGLHHLLFQQHFADRAFGFGSALRLFAQRLLQLGLRQRAALDEDLAQTHLFFRQVADQINVFGDLAVRRQDADLAIVAHELECAFDGRLVGCRLVTDLEAEMAGFRIELRDRRHRFDHGDDVDDLAEGIQVTDEGQGIHAVAQYVLAEAQRDVPVVGLDAVAAGTFETGRMFHRHAAFCRLCLGLVSRDRY